MNKIILNFKIVAMDIQYDLLMDKRLSFIENFKLLGDLILIDIDKVYIMYFNIPLRKDIPLETFDLPYVSNNCGTF